LKPLPDVAILYQAIPSFQKSLKEAPRRGNFAVVMAALFREEEASREARPLLDPNFEVNGVRYSVTKPETVYARLASNCPQREEIIELLTHYDYKNAMRLHLWIALAPGQDPRAEVARIAIRYSMMVDDSASSRADRVKVHCFVQQQLNKMLIVFEDVFVERPSLAVPPIAVWCSKPADDRGAALVGNRAPVDIQPYTTGRYHVPATGGLDYVCSARPDGHCETLALRDVIPACMPVPGDDRRAGETRARIVIKPFMNYRSGLRVTPQFKMLARSMSNERAGIGRDANIADRVASEQLHQDYLERLAETQEGVIDLSNTQWVWSANSITHVRKRLLEEVGKDAREDGENRFLFTNARAFLNRMFARATAPSDRLWIKIPKSDHEAEGAALQETSVSQFLKETKNVFFNLPAPVDPDIAQRTLHGKVKINEDGDYSFVEWYLKIGARCVQGTRFWPLCVGETLLDAHHRDHINTFAGFRCQTWIRDDLAGCRRAHSDFLYGPEENNRLQVLLDHIRNICGGDEHTYTARLTWIALTCFYPALKVPTAHVDKGPPGCGKSSLTEAIGERLLNKVHIRKVTKLDQIVGRFNAIVEKTVLTIVEELDFKGERQAAMNALNGTRRRTECLGGRDRALPPPYTVPSTTVRPS
jgi:hypothetical protein